MAKSHPAPSDEHSVSRPTFWARNPLASMAALISIASIAFVVHLPAGSRLAGMLAQSWGTIELPELALNRIQAQPAAVDPNQAKYRTIGDYLAQRFRVSAEVTTHVVAKAYDIGHELNLDPMLILAVIAVESRFNPVAESVMGAKGLMQVIPRYHPDKFGPLGGEQVAFDPAVNITVGAKILSEYIRRSADLNGALQLYVGASSEETGNGYPGKVIAERERLHGVLRQFLSRAGLAEQQAQAKLLPSAI
jgi:soluble lytic murein transglycosylase-like protein